MPGIKGLIFKFWDPLGTVCSAVNEWEPVNFNSESEVEDSIYEYLNLKLDGLEVRRQFPYDRIRADILIERHVAIEIKINLTSTSEFQRLIGQLETYAQWGILMLVLVVGDCDKNLKHRVEERLKKDWEDVDYARFIHLPVN